jgi:hypothetical protein
MLDPVNVRFVLANEVIFCSLPEELQAKIIETVTEVVSKMDILEQEIVTQASLIKASVIYSQICLEHDFMPLTEEAQAKMMGAVNTALEMLNEAQPQQEVVLAQESDIPVMFGMKVTQAIDLPDTYDFEVDIPVEEEREDEDMQEYLSGILAGVEEAILDIVKDTPVSQSVVDRMYKSVRSQFESGELTIGNVLQEQPSLIFIPVV